MGRILAFGQTKATTAILSGLALSVLTVSGLVASWQPDLLLARSQFLLTGNHAISILAIAGVGWLALARKGSIGVLAVLTVCAMHEIAWGSFMWPFPNTMFEWVIILALGIYLLKEPARFWLSIPLFIVGIRLFMIGLGLPQTIPLNPTSDTPMPNLLEIAGWVVPLVAYSLIALRKHNGGSDGP